ncbi:hypothetical protein GGS26DRAFT_53922 [Hypomontagnella submonticulosa]|nr:hypothetical protein GGS26DRAFT_53922 [Hypomontagnella submonticulosa]
MIRFLVFLLLLTSGVVSFPAEVAGVGFSALTNVSEHVSSMTSPSNGTAIVNNSTVIDERFNEHWQYNDKHVCPWARKYIQTISSECSEYCEADSYYWGYQFHRLRYHIKISANGQDPKAWCDNFKARMMTNCWAGEPDFFNCNTGRAPELTELRVWVSDGTTGKMTKKTGINLRFDFNPWWEPRDAMHDCVTSAIREATCADMVFDNGLRCIPTMYESPQGASEFGDQSVPPSDKCWYNADVPQEAT